MKIVVLGSSSAGNCYLLQTPTGTLVIEAGVSFQEVKKAVDFDLSGIVGVLVSHSHKDHSKAVVDFMKAGIDVYCSTGTMFELKTDSFNDNIYKWVSVEDQKQFSIGDFIVLPFKVEHDCPESDPMGYLIYYRPTGEKLLFVTDSFYSRYTFTGLNYIMLECNYCDEILRENVASGRIPKPLKDRVLHSHFSLKNVLDFLKANNLSKARKIILMHLSDANSDAARMVRDVHELTGIETVVADKGMEIELELCPF